MDYTKFAVTLEGERWITGRKRRTVQRIPYYISSVSFKEGDGLRIKRFQYSSDKAKALALAKFTAEAIVKQLSDGSWGRRYLGVKIESLQ